MENSSHKRISKKMRILAIQIYILLQFILLVNANCQGHLLSLSSVNSCENGLCRYSDVITGKIDLVEGTKFCIDLQVQGIEDPVDTLNIIVLDSWVRYPLVNCYTSDDPSYAFAGVCGCPGSSTIATCSSCPVSAPPNSYSTCISGIAKSTGCLITNPAAYCSQVWLEGGSRYKVCDITKGHLELNLNISIGSKNNAINADLITSITVSGTDYEITFFPRDIDNLSGNKRMILDLLTKDKFYLVPKEITNSIETDDPAKLGWFRFNNSLPTKINQFIETYVQDCQNDQFLLTSAASSIQSYLNSHPQTDSSVSYPGSLLIDPMASQIQIPNNQYTASLPVLYQGGYFFDSSGDIIAHGITPDEKLPYPETAVRNSITVQTTCGLITSNFLCTNWHELMLPTQNDGVWWLQTCQQISSPNCWGGCVKTWNGATNGTANVCNGGSIPAIKYPTYQAGYWQYWYPFNFNIPANFTINTHSDSILMPFSDAYLDFKLTLDNIPVRFRTSTIEPIIDRVDSNDRDIKVWAHSKSNEGNCLLISEDDLFYTKEVKLEKEEQQFEVRIFKESYNGYTTIILQCYKNNDKVKFKVEIRHDNPDVNKVSINDETVREASLNWSFGKYVWYVLGLPFLMLAGMSNFLPRLTWITVIIYLTFSLILFYFFYKSWSYFRNKRQQNKSKLPLGIRGRSDKIYYE